MMKFLVEAALMSADLDPEFVDVDLLQPVPALAGHGVNGVEEHERLHVHRHYLQTTNMATIFSRRFSGEKSRLYSWLFVSVFSRRVLVENVPDSHSR